ncbi:MAG: ClpXP protease specificity-enhancing factor [Nitrosospira sp.]|nr:ClpXP protease specificity-enhancing factor [Nitrosospira sp.]
MKELSTKSYLIRAIYEWCSDSSYTPYLSVKVDAETRVPSEFVQNGEIILNISHDAAHHLTLGNDVIQFSARFNSISREISVPVYAVQGIFAKETSQGILFPREDEANMARTEAGIEEMSKSQPTSQTSSPLVGEKRRFQVIK